MNLVKVSKFAEAIGVKKRKAYYLIRDGLIPREALVRIPGVRGLRVDIDKLNEIRQDWKVS